MKRALLTTISLTTLLLAGCAAEDGQSTRTVPVKPPQFADGYWYLDQNWNSEGRQWYYNTTQGSQIMPYAWFMALRDPATRAPFAQSLPRFGYLPDTDSRFNPDKLAVGFGKDTDPDGKTWVGMTCAACHTGDLQVGDKTIRIDGGPATGDLHGFIAALSGAIQATLKDEAEFAAFSKAVLGANPASQQRLKLYNDLKTFGGDFATFVTQSTPPVPWGPARTDAFQMIFNRIAVIDLKDPSNNRLPSAPVSYPHLWSAPFQPVAQWNGAVPNVGRAKALARNAGEVLGVFGKADLKAPTTLHYYYDSTVRAKELIDMEDQLRVLRSPVWPDQLLGDVDIAKAAAGEQIYKNTCESCHQILPRDQEVTNAPIKMVPLFTYNADVQPVLQGLCAPAPNAEAAVKRAVDAKLIAVSYATDPTMAVDALCRKVKTGAIAGSKMPPIFGTALEKVDSGVSVLSNTVVGALIGTIVKDPEVLAKLLEDNPAPTPWQPTASATTAAATAKARPVPFKDSRPFVRPKAGEPESEQALAVIKKLAGTDSTETAAAADAPPVPLNLLAYKARPLDGIWATAPYLHNGSVPSLYELLLPAEQRSARFPVGSKRFDPVKVGVDVSAKDGAVFDTTLPGNRNTGHEWTGDLTDTQRWQLVEYLKTL